MDTSRSPLAAMLTRIPTVAEELWRIVVSTKPTRTAKKGFFNEPSIDISWAESLIPAMASFIMVIPRNSVPKPNTTSPTFFTVSFLKNIIITTPIITKIGATESKSRETICAVTVVPILAPIITPTACIRFISPELTKLTTITVVALEDCMMAVNTAPTITPTSLFFVHHSKMVFIFEPATFSIPSPISFMP